MPRPQLISYIAIAIGMLIAIPAYGVVERRLERRFDVPAHASLKLNTFSGAVRVVSEPDIRFIQIVVVQTAEVESESAMDDRLADLSLTMNEQNGTVAVEARYNSPVSLTWTSWPPVNLSYEIRVPRRCDVHVVTRDGSIAVGSLEGAVVLRSDGGKIFVGEIDGSLHVRSVTGQVGITAASGPMDVATTSGNITVGRAGARTLLASQGGYIELQRAGGPVVVKGNGSDAEVGFSTPIRHAADIALSGGNLALVIETTSECLIDARSSVFGKVDVRGELPIKIVAGSEGSTRLKAKVNGGGPRITARARGGNVLVRAVEPVPQLAAEATGQ